VRGVTIRTTMAYTVKQLAQLAGVSIRTLHHYDEIGLLTPPVIGANGYRYYDERSALRLQSILFYRDLEFSLEAIEAVLDRPDFDALTALREQRSETAEKIAGIASPRLERREVKYTRSRPSDKGTSVGSNGKRIPSGRP